MIIKTGKSVALLCLVVTMAAGGLGYGDETTSGDGWPMARRDSTRSGSFSSSGAITQPAIMGSLDLGRTLDSFSYLMHTIGGARTCFLIVQGRVQATLPLPNGQTSVQWTTMPLGVTELAGVGNLNGDDIPDLVALRNVTPAEVVVINALTGAVQWRYGAFQDVQNISHRGLVNIVDLNADGLSELVVRPSYGAGEALAFTFANGFASNSADNLAWRAVLDGYKNYNAPLVGDVDGDGAEDVVLFQNTMLTALNGQTGATKRRMTGVFTMHAFGPAWLRNADDDPALELVAVGTSSYNHTAGVIDLGTGTVKWQYQWLPTANRGIRANMDSLADFDHDGRLELAISLYNDADDELTSPASAPADYDGVNFPDRWVTVLFDVETGAVKLMLPDRALMAAGNVTGGSAMDLITVDAAPGRRILPSRGLLRVGWFDEDGSYRELLVSEDPCRISMQYPFTHGGGTGMDTQLLPILPSSMADGKQSLAARCADDEQGPDTSLRLYDLFASTAPSASLALDPRNPLTLVGLGGDPTPDDLTLLATFRPSDGALLLRNNRLDVTHQLPAGSSAAVPIVAMDAAAGFPTLAVALADGSVGFRRLDPGDEASAPDFDVRAYLDSALEVVGFPWSDGSTAFVVSDAITTDNPAIRMITADEHEVWRHVFEGSPSALLRQFFPVMANGDQQPDVGLYLNDMKEPAATRRRLAVLDGLTGGELWNIPIAGNGEESSNCLVAAFGPNDVVNGASPIVVGNATSLEYFDPTNGALLHRHGDVYFPRWIVLLSASLDGDPGVLVGNHSINQGIQRYDLGADQPRWKVPVEYEGQLIAYPALLRNPPGVAVVTTDAQLFVLNLDGSLRWRVNIGEITRDGEPIAPFTLLEPLAADIDNDGNEDLVLASTDGHLRALNAADGAVLWDYRFGQALSAPIAADVDGDGFLELLVVSSDGRLHLIDQARLPAPSEILDIPIAVSGQPQWGADDVDETDYALSLAASWTAVEAAAGYLVAVKDEAGGLLTSWRDVGTARRAVFPLILQVGRRYAAVVKAYDEIGRMGMEGSSDGVTLRANDAPLIEFFEAAPAYWNPWTGPLEGVFHIRDTVGLDSAEVAIGGDIGESYRKNWYFASSLTRYETFAWDGRLDDSGAMAPDGIYQVQLTVANVGGLHSAALQAVTLDAAPPPAPRINEPVDDAILSDQTPLAVLGEAEAAASVEVRIEAEEAPLSSQRSLCFAVADSLGVFQCAGDAADLSPGWVILTAVARDRAGNRSPASASRRAYLGSATENSDGDAEDETSEDAPDGQEDELAGDAPTEAASEANTEAEGSSDGLDEGELSTPDHEAAETAGDGFSEEEYDAAARDGENGEDATGVVTVSSSGCHGGANVFVGWMALLTLAALVARRTRTRRIAG